MGVTRQYLRYKSTASFGLIGSIKGGLVTLPSKKNLVRFCKILFAFLGKNYYVGIWILNSKHSNREFVWIANFYLFSIQMVANWMVWTIILVTMVISLITKFHLVTNLFTVRIGNYYFAFQDMAWIMDQTNFLWLSSRNSLFRCNFNYRSSE